MTVVVEVFLRAYVSMEGFTSFVKHATSIGVNELYKHTLWSSDARQVSDSVP